MKTTTVNFKSRRLRAIITVTEASVKHAMTRARLKIEGEVEAAKLEDTDEKILRVYLYPDIVAATTGVLIYERNGTADEKVLHDKMMIFAEFLELPEPLAAKWENAIYELNPHWANREPEEADDPDHPKESPTGSMPVSGDS